MKLFATILLLLSIKAKQTVAEFNKSNKTILILADGIRYDYVNDEQLIGFRRLALNGVRAQYVQPIFPANSYPNWYTIVTGLYGESHGFVQNYMYDPRENDTFIMNSRSSVSRTHWWTDAEPIWITAEKHGIKTAVFWWDGCQVRIRETEPTLCLEYQSYWTRADPYGETVDAFKQILDAFERDEWRFALVYYETIDTIGHLSGAESAERVRAVRQFDSILAILQDEIENRQMRDEVNIVVVSDHGMADVDEERIINIENIVDVNDVEVMLDKGTTAFLIPKPGKENDILKALIKSKTKGLQFYRRDQLPNRYHVKHHRRVSPIILVADKGYYISEFSDDSKTMSSSKSLYTGQHGYDPYEVEEMRTIMYARGPGFKKNYTSQPLMMTDHYNILCYTLGVEAQPNNGTWSRVQDMTSYSGANALSLKFEL